MHDNNNNDHPLQLLLFKIFFPPISGPCKGRGCAAMMHYGRARTHVFRGSKTPCTNERVMVSLLCTDENEISGWAGSGYGRSRDLLMARRRTARKRGTGAGVQEGGRRRRRWRVETRVLALSKMGGKTATWKKQKRRGGASTTCT